MTILYFLLCILQPICLPVPEMVTILWGSMTIGPRKSFVYGVAGALIGIAVMYVLAKKFSECLIKKLKCEKKVKRFQDYIKNYQIYIVGILFIVPILPDEIICLGSPLVGIRFSLFMGIAVAAKLISVGMIAYSEPIGAIIGLSNLELIAVELVVLFAVAKLYTRREKAEEDREAEPLIIENV